MDSANQRGGDHLGLATWAFLFMSVDVIGSGIMTHTQEDPRASDKSLVRYLLKSTAKTNCRDYQLQVKTFGSNLC